MSEFFLCNSKGRDATVMAESLRTARRVRWLDADGRQAASSRALKGTMATDMDSLVARFGTLDKVARGLIDADPEIDLEVVGGLLHDTARVYIDADKKVVHSVQIWEIVRNVDGSERSRRRRATLMPNVTAEQPIRWSGKYLSKKEAFNKFVMTNKLQIVHTNGLTYDFLFEMAKELEQKDSLLLLGAGPKSNQPLILRRNATPYRGFLEGRTRDEDYCLILHLSNLELKAPEIAAPEAS
jgi:hypothetical protein